MRARRPIRRLALIGVGLLALTVAGCGADGADTLTIYSGRNEQLVGPLLQRLAESLGTDVEIRYGDSAELAAQLLEEGEASEADLFFSQDAGALGALAQQGRLARLPDRVRDVVPDRYQADDGSWLATSARARVVAYDPEQVTEAELPNSLDDLTDPRWRGRIGYAPSNASWQSFVTGVRVLRGEDGARQWLTAFAATEPERYGNNLLVLDAVDRGEVQLGLINHYYWYERVAEKGERNVTARIHYVGGGDPLGLVNVAGVGVLAGADSPDAARAAVEFLLSKGSQQYFADETAEYPVRAGIRSTEHDLPALDRLNPPAIDLSQLASLQQTLALLQETGLS